jgi:hypothetical protein
LFTPLIALAMLATARTARACLVCADAATGDVVKATRGVEGTLDRGDLVSEACSRGAMVVFAGQPRRLRMPWAGRLAGETAREVLIEAPIGGATSWIAARVAAAGGATPSPVGAYARELKGYGA